MDNFGVKYFSTDDSDHLLNSLKKHCAVSKYWEGCNYLVLEIYWKYNEGYVDILIPDYVTKAPKRLHYSKAKRPKYAPHLWIVPAYRKIIQMPPRPDESNMLDKKITKKIKFVVSTLLYYARSVEPTMLRAINGVSRIK